MHNTTRGRTFKSPPLIVLFSVVQSPASVTRFGKILKLFGNFFVSIFCIWHTFKHIRQILCHWADFHWCKWPNIEKEPCHLVTLSDVCRSKAFYSATVRAPFWLNFVSTKARKKLVLFRFDKSKVIANCGFPIAFSIHSFNWERFRS